MGRIIDDATMAQIEQEMKGDGVWIDPEFARVHDISAADELLLEQTVAGAENVDLKMVLVDVSRDDDRFQGSFHNLSAWLHDSLGGDATYVGWEQYAEPQLTARAYGDQPETLHAADIAVRDHPDDFVDQVGRLQELLDVGNARQLWEQIPREERYSWLADESAWDRFTYWVDDLSAGGWAGIVAVGLVAAAGGVTWWRTRSSRRATDTTFELPTTVLRSVRAAEDRQLRQQADREVLALGEALGAQDPAAGSLAAWQQALDHFDAARAVLDRAGSPADVVGALVLARRGDSARRAAIVGEAGGTWRPPATCYFNPLHPGGTQEVTWQHEERSVSVPACGDCATRVRRGKEPEDVLDFISGDNTVHYYRLDIGAWSRTGYGALESDLIGALRQGRGRRRRRR